MELIRKTLSQSAILLLMGLLLSGCIEEDNSAPEANDDQSATTQGGSVVIEVLGNDRDSNDDHLTVTHLSSPEHGRATLQSDGKVLYQHDGSNSAEDTFTYTANDGAKDSEVAKVVVTIEVEDTEAEPSDIDTPPPASNHQPIAVTDTLQVERGGSISFDLTANDTDGDQDSLRIDAFTQAEHGSLQQQANGVTIVYHHDGSDTTQDSFSYTVTDGQARSTPTRVNVRISDSNQPPVFIHSGQNTRTPVDQLFSITVEASDPDGDPLEYQVSGLPYWLVYTEATHTLAGSPSWEELGDTHEITVRVTDGQVSIENRFTLVVVEADRITDSMAHRLLLQSTFGPTLSEMARVKSLGIAGWIDRQLTLGSAYTSPSDGWKTHLERTEEIARAAEPGTDWLANSIFNQTTSDRNALDYQMAAWWDNALGASAPHRTQIGSDLLRQRVAFALSQLLVVSDSTPTLRVRGEALATYYDLLAQHAFGNYRQLLKAVATSPAMGVYLSHQGNRKADPDSGSRPDENFAREIIQLFTLGLYELNQDGSPNRDGNSLSYPDTGSNIVATYTQQDIEELAKVMTGWDLANNSRYGRLSSRDGDYTHPMVFNAAEHEDEAAEGGDGRITLLGHTLTLNAGSDQSGLDAALDVLFSHPNLAPYVSKHLIQRLITSNPSSDYVARISAVFNDNGQGVKGDLKAVVRAILLDPEARDERYFTNPTYGKYKEPLLALTQLLRAAHVTPLNGWQSKEGRAMQNVYWYRNPENAIEQGALRSPTVFNFYSPNYIPSDTYFKSHAMAAPEMQIQTEQMLINYSNLVYTILNNLEVNRITKTNSKTLSEFAASRRHYSINLLTSFDTELTLMEQAMEQDQNGDFATFDDTETDASGKTPRERAINALIDHLDLLLLGGNMTPDYRTALQHYLLSSSDTNTSNHFERARRMIRDAYVLIATSSAYMIQK
ncbi:MAG: DUF1800 family protein [Candidatus Thiodiazotropha sp.]